MKPISISIAIALCLVLSACKGEDPEAAAKAIQADIAWGGKIMIDWLIKREQEAEESEASNARK